MQTLRTHIAEFRTGYVPGSILKDFQISVSRGQTAEKKVYFKLCAYFCGMRIKETETLVTEEEFRKNFQSHFDSSILFCNALELIGFDKLVLGGLTMN